MKTFFLIFVMLIMGMFIVSANNDGNTEKATHLIFGKVVDKVSGEEIAGAEIKLDDKIIYTDLDGNFSANINVNKPELTAKYISYNDTKITVNIYSYDTVIIELSSK